MDASVVSVTRVVLATFIGLDNADLRTS